MPGQSPNGRKNSLDQYGIYRVPCLDVADCPDQLQDLFKLIQGAKSLRFEKFGGRRENHNNLQPFETKAAHDYDAWLKRQADSLTHKSRDPKMVDKTETEWVSVLAPDVFHPFDRMQEEVLEERRPFHHCLVCRRHFKPGSRPIINDSKTMRTQAMQQDIVHPSRTRDILRPDLEICDCHDRHFNLPNFNKAQELPYHDDDGEVQCKPGVQIPDMTIGLLTYDINKKPWHQRDDFLGNDRIKLFDRGVLDAVLKHFELEAPYREIKNKPRFIAGSHPMFAFALWEAKKSTSPDNHITTLQQTARKLATLIRWQVKIFGEAKFGECNPLVWFFSSVGSTFEVFGCYGIKHPTGDGYTYLVSLWAGKLEELDEAPQLLYIVDIIRLWAEHTYKPAIGTCINRLLALQAGLPLIPLEETLWGSRIAIDRSNTPWLYGLEHREQLARNPALGASSNNLDVASNPHSPLSSSPSREISESVQRSPRPSRALTPIGQRYVIPETNDYTWLLDRDPGRKDLLLIRINDEGRLLRPIVVFSSAKWSDPEFDKILDDEDQRHHPGVSKIFRFDKKRRHYLWKSVFRTNYLRREVQFCAVLPLSRSEYNRQRLKKKDCNIFDPLESLLDVSGLLAKVHKTYSEWCVCNGPGNEPGVAMILCDNVGCRIGWYHNYCVGLSEAFGATFWLCPECRHIPRHERVYTKDLDVENDWLVEKSSQRVQRTRSLYDVWCEHPWPTKAETLRAFKKIAMNLDVVSKAEFHISSRSKQENAEVPRTRVLSKDSPRKLIMAGTRERQLVYHQNTATADNSDVSEETYTNGYSESDGEDVYDLEDRLGSISLGQH